MLRRRRSPTGVLRSLQQLHDQQAFGQYRAVVEHERGHAGRRVGGAQPMAMRAMRTKGDVVLASNCIARSVRSLHGAELLEHAQVIQLCPVLDDHAIADLE